MYIILYNGPYTLTIMARFDDRLAAMAHLQQYEGSTQGQYLLVKVVASK